MKKSKPIEKMVETPASAPSIRNSRLRNPKQAITLIVIKCPVIHGDTKRDILHSICIL